MEPEQVCIFCGQATEERQETSIGVIYIHADCLADLQDVLSNMDKEWVVAREGSEEQDLPL